jgi:hypothetical protein
MRAQAEMARDDLARLVKRKVAATVGGYNQLTGQFTAGCSADARKGFCAEDAVAAQIGGDNPSNVVFTPAVRMVGGGKLVPVQVCKQCQENYARDQFPPDIGYEENFAWDIFGDLP